MIAAIYTRVSTDEQAERGLSLVVQDIPTPLSQARRQYRPCSRCHPPT